MEAEALKEKVEELTIDLEIIKQEISAGDGEGAPIHMPMIRLETVENHRMYCLMPSDNFIVKKSRTQAGIEPTTFGVPTHCSNH